MTLKQKISFVWHLPLARKQWLLGCVLGSIVVLLPVYLLPSKYLRHFLGHSNENRPLCVLVTPEQFVIARQIASLMKTVAANVPWPCQCLAQAICVNWLFKVQRIPSVTYLGAKFSSDDVKGLKAHAWVSVGDTTVIGNHDDNYAVVGVFTPINLSSMVN